MGVRFTDVEFWNRAPSHERSLLVGLHLPRAVEGWHLLAAAGVGQMACARCTTTRFDTISTAPVSWRVVEVPVAVSYGVSAHLEAARLIGRVGGIGLAVLAGHSRAMTYVSPQLTIQLGHMPRG
jgi:hypothetical protein